MDSDKRLRAECADSRCHFLRGRPVAGCSQKECMNDLEYRLLAIELVRQVHDLLVHAGSKKALATAELWAAGKTIAEDAIDQARARALETCVQCADETRDGRAYAAEAAWQLLAPQIEEWLPQIIENVARAKALRAVFKKHGSLNPASQDEFDYIRAVEQELLEDRVSRHRKKS